MAKGTRQKIMDTARRLFNEHSYSAVTNEDLANAVGIATGNIWYHFRKQRDLLSALSEEFLVDINQRLGLRPLPDGDVVADYINLLQDMGREFRHHRFLYRDQTDFGEFTAELRDAAPDLFERTVVQFMAFLTKMIADNVLDWEVQRVRDLATATVILLRYSLETERETTLSNKLAEGAFRRSIKLHVSLIEGRLSPRAAARIRQALEDKNWVLD